MKKLNYIQVYLLEYTGQKIVFDIRQKLFNHVENLTPPFFDRNPVGRLARINSFLSENISGMKTVQIYNNYQLQYKNAD